MRTLLLMTLCITLAAQSHIAQVAEGPSVLVVGFKWSKSRQAIVNPNNERGTPAKSAMIPANRINERNRRVNDQMGARDPNADTLDGRSAALEKSVQDARSPKAKPVDGFLYQIKIRNANTKAIEVLFWEYQFKERSNPANVVSHQFLCGLNNLKPDKERELKVFSTSGPSNLISVDSMEAKSANIFEEQIVINRVEFADGTVWQRKDWNVAEIKASIERALATPWGSEMCRSL